jgi:drug/metabolite transporter (DMT)-like permease
VHLYHREDKGDLLKIYGLLLAFISLLLDSLSIILFSELQRRNRNIENGIENKKKKMNKKYSSLELMLNVNIIIAVVIGVTLMLSTTIPRVMRPEKYNDDSISSVSRSRFYFIPLISVVYSIGQTYHYHLLDELSAMAFNEFLVLGSIITFGTSVLIFGPEFNSNKFIGACIVYSACLFDLYDPHT